MVHQLTRRSPQLSPVGGLIALTAVGFLWFWSNANARPLLLLAIGLVLAVIIDGAWGFRALRHPGLDVTNPSDAMVGESLAVTVRVDGLGRPARLTMLSMPGSPGAIVDPSQPGLLDVVPLTSGRFPWAIFELTVRGPLGLIGWTRRLVVRLPDSLHVSPRFVTHEVELPRTAGSRNGLTPGMTGQQDLVRTVRDYSPSDGSRLIHWGATARTGRLMVKELDPTGAGNLTIVVDLRPDDIGDGAEAAAGRAGHLADRALADGWCVTLVFNESADDPAALMPVLTSNRLPIRIVKRPAARTLPVSKVIRSHAEAARHLAGADFGPTDSTRWRPGATRIVSSSGEDRWH